MNRRWTELHDAASDRNIDEVCVLLSTKCDINAIDQAGDTPLHIAVLYNHIESVEMILESGADVNAANDDGDTPLHYVSDRDIVKLLVDKGANINAQNKEGNTPLHEIGVKGFHEAVRELIIAGASLSIKNHEGESAFEYVLNKDPYEWREIELDVAALAGHYGNQEMVLSILEEAMSS